MDSPQGFHFNKRVAQQFTGTRRRVKRKSTGKVHRQDSFDQYLLQNESIQESEPEYEEFETIDFKYKTREYSSTAFATLQSYRATNHWTWTWRYMAHWNGSIWEATWFELLIFLIMYYIIYTVLHVFCNDDQRENFYKFSNMAVWAKSNVGMIPLSFLLGFFHDAMHTRWRAMWDTVWWPDALCETIYSSIKGDTAEIADIRDRICRYSFLTSVIAMGDCTYDVNVKYRNFDVMLQKGWITEEEVQLFRLTKDSMPHRSSWWIPSQWAANLLSEAHEKGYVSSDFMWSKCWDELMHMRAQNGKMWDYYIVGVPVLYMQTAVFATYAYVMLILVGQSQFNPDETSGSINFYFPIFSVVEVVIYVGWLNLSLCLTDPFGRQKLDDISWDLDWIIHRNWEVMVTMGRNYGVTDLQSFKNRNMT